ncbi:MAG: AtpZ/AtpI family protein [Eubacteriales bacterium]|nr:AtpZ/AtpI family protein [Eubacteriales bacterium]
MKKKIFKTYILILQLGITMISSIVIGLIIGLCIKHFFKLDIIIIFLLFGIISGFINSYKLIKSTHDLGKSSISKSLGSVKSEMEDKFK